MSEITIRNCCIRAARYLGLKELALELENDSAPAAERDKFLAMARDVVSEVASEFFPFIKEEAVKFNGGILLLEHLKERANQILGVRSGGSGVRFSVKYDRIEAPVKDEATIAYSYLPTVVDMDTVVSAGHQINERILGFGIAAEYCLINGLTDAILWDKRYKDALRRVLFPRVEKRVKRRLWW